MTTKSSPLSTLKAQANNIAAKLKAVGRGETPDVPFAEKINAARAKESLKFGVVMDDKIITVDIPWATLRDTTESALAEYILNQMLEARDAIH